MEMKQLVETALYEVIDPELGINIVDLGLIYQIDIVDHSNVNILMTLTTPGCPLHDSITNGVEEAVRQIPGVEVVAIQITWQPAWTPDKMSMKAKEMLF